MELLFPITKHDISVMGKCILNLILLGLLVFGNGWTLHAQGIYQGTIKYFNTATILQDYSHIVPIPVDTGSGVLSKDTLFQLVSKVDKPVSYYRKIVKEICFDGSCRVLKVNLYWNVTGRYLGFELPPQEFLSKAEHKPFVSQEYEQLHAILADSLSALGTYRYEQLIPKQAPISLVDGVTRPTSIDVLQHVVKGAVFTTYSMWHLVYGQMQRDVEEATASTLDAVLLLDIMQSPVPWDWMWGLDRVYLVVDAPDALKQRALSFISKDSFGLASKAIASIPDQWCVDVDFQQALWSRFDEVPFALKPSLIQKLAKSQSLDKSILLALSEQLSGFNGALLDAALTCLQKYATIYPEIKLNIVALAKHNNPYIAKQAQKFLQEIDRRN